MLPIKDHTPSERFPFVTIALIILNIGVFYLEWTGDTEAFIQMWALVPSKITASPSTWYPFVTSQFLHGGFAHILFNMWYLWIFGDNIEGRMGHVQYLLFYLTAGVAAALAQFFFSVGSEIPMLGASGAIAGVLGAYWALFSHHRVDTMFPGTFARATLPAGTVLFFWFITQLISGTGSIIDGSFVGGGTAWFAHIGGFVFGWAVGKVMYGGPGRSRVSGG